MLSICGKVGTIAAILVVTLVGCDGRKAPADEKKQVSREPSGVPGRYSGSMSYTRNLRLGEYAEITSVVGEDTLKSIFSFDIPVRRLVVLSSAQVGYLLRLGAADRIVAVGEGKYIADSSLYARVANGDVAEIGYGNSMDFEKLVSLKPDYVMTFATGGSQDDYERLGALGLPAMLTSEWQEESPLAKAEWIKLYGMMLDDGDNGMALRADSIFRDEVAKYAGIAVHDKPRKNLQGSPDGVSCDGPRVLAGMSYGGVWYAPGGNSYTAHLVKDAGGCYLWAGDTTRELRLTLEEVMAVADSADVWINPGMYGIAADIAAADPRVANFRPFREKRVYQNDGRKGPGGGNDFFESAVAKPAEVLENLRDCLFNTNCGVNPEIPSGWFHNIF